jgi:hypothetical protein
MTRGLRPVRRATRRSKERVSLAEARAHDLANAAGWVPGGVRVPDGVAHPMYLPPMNFLSLCNRTE